MPIFGPIINLINGIRKGISTNKKSNKLIQKLKDIESKNILNLISDKEYAQIYINQLEYFDLKKNQVSPQYVLKKNQEIIKKMENYINKQGELLKRENATQLDIAKVVASLQKLQLGQDCLADGIVEWDDNLKELSDDVENIESVISNLEKDVKNISNITKEITSLHNKFITQDKTNIEIKESINHNIRNTTANIEDLKNKILTLDKRVIQDTELLKKQSNQLHIAITSVKELITQNDTAIKKEIREKNLEIFKQIEIQTQKISTIENKVNNISQQILTLSTNYHENKRIVESQFASLENTIDNLYTEHKRQTFRFKIYLSMLFIIILATLTFCFIKI